MTCGRPSTSYGRQAIPELDDHLDGSLVAPVDPDWVTAFFEHTAGRRPHPGEPRLAG